MAQTGVVSWSTSTGTSNGTADSNVNWAEGMPPASVNDSARNEMASVAKWRDDISGLLSAGGTSTAYTLTSNQTFSTLGYLNGQRLCFSINTTNGASATLNVDGLGAKQLQIGSVTALPAGVFKAGQRYDVSYNSSGGYFLVHGFTDTFNTITAGAITATSISTSGTANFAGTLTGAAIIGSSVSVSGNAIITGGTSVGGTLNVAGLATLSGGVSGLIAAQSDQETATSTTLAVPPGRQHFHPSAAKAWFKGSFVDQTITASYHVSSFTDGAAGIQTVNWATSFSSANYAVVLTKQNDSPWIVGTRIGGSAMTASLCDLIATDSASSGGDIIIMGVAYGDYA